MKAVGALIVALGREFVRDRTALFFTLAFPFIFMLIFGLLMQGLDRPRNFDIGLVIDDASPAASELADALRRLPVLEITEEGFDAEQDRLKEGDRDAVIVVPEGFGDTVAAGSTARVRVFFDPSRQTTATIVLPILSQILDEIDRVRAGTPRGLAIEPVSVVASDLRAVDFVAPGIIAMSVMQLGVFSSINLVMRREKLILKRLGATPIRRGTVIGAEVLFRLIITSVQAALLVAMASLAFGVPIEGGFHELIAIIGLGALAFIGLGFAISSFAKTEEGMLPIAQIVTLPMMFLSGIFFPIDGLPGFLQPVLRVLPLTFLGDGIRQTMVGGFSVNAMWVNYLALALWLAVTFVVAVRLFKWE